MNAWKKTFERGYLAFKKNQIVDTLKKQKLFNFFQEAQNMGAVISGSFILQFLANTIFENSDIDIFYPLYETQEEFENIRTNEENEDIISEYIQEIINLDKRKMKIEALARRMINLFEKYNPHYITSESSYGGRVLNVTTFSLKEDDLTHIVQVIMVSLRHGETIQDFVKKDFDFSFCMSTFDGDNIKAVNLFDTMRKVGYLSGTSPRKRDFRIRKYQDRGFLIKNV
jgi:hypothetical protein